MGCGFCKPTNKPASYRSTTHGDDADEVEVKVVDVAIERQITVWDRGASQRAEQGQSTDSTDSDNTEVPPAPLIADASDDEINVVRQRIFPNNGEAPRAVVTYMAGKEGRGRGDLNEAVAWLVDALTNAHCHKSVLEAARKLLVAGNFTVNLSVMGQWRGIQEQVHEHLETLGKPLLQDFERQMLAIKLSNDVLEPFKGACRREPVPGHSREPQALRFFSAVGASPP